MADETPQIPRAERVIAYMIASSVGLAVVSFVATIIGTAVGVRDFSQGLWPLAFVLTPLALVFGFILLLTLLILTAVRRSRGARDANG